MKLAKGLKTSSRKKTIAKSLAELPETLTQTIVPEVKPAETTTGTSGSGAKPVTIEAKIDVGFGNTLYLRGEGVGLSWTQGVPLTCVDGKTWKQVDRISVPMNPPLSVGLALSGHNNSALNSSLFDKVTITP